MNKNLVKNTSELSNKKNKDGNIVIHEHYLNALTLLIATLISVAIGVWATYTFPWAVQYVPIFDNSLSIPFPLFGLISLALLALFMRAILNIKLVLCPQYLIYVSGVVSWKERTIRVEYENIREIEIDQTLYQKLFNLGDVIVLIVSTQIENSLEMPGVKNPRMLKDYLQQKMHQAKDPNPNATE